MVKVLSSSALKGGFEPRSGTKDYIIGICYLFTKHTSLKSKSNDLLSQNQDSVSEWR